MAVAQDSGGEAAAGPHYDAANATFPKVFIRELKRLDGGMLGFMNEMMSHPEVYAEIAAHLNEKTPDANSIKPNSELMPPGDRYRARYRHGEKIDGASFKGTHGYQSFAEKEWHVEKMWKQKDPIDGVKMLDRGLTRPSPSAHSIRLASAALSAGLLVGPLVYNYTVINLRDSDANVIDTETKKPKAAPSNGSNDDETDR